MIPEANRERILSQLTTECSRQIEQPPSVDGEQDKYIGMFALAVRNSLQQYPHVSDKLAYVENIKKMKGPYPPNYLFNSLLRHSQRLFMFDNNGGRNRYNPAYPYEDQDQWTEKVSELMSDEEAFNRLAIHMIIWNVGSDVETRIAGPKLVAHTLQSDRVQNVDDPFTLLNVGSARDHSLAMLSGNVAIPDVRVMDKNFSREQQKFWHSRINELLSKEVGIGDCYGVDMWPFRDEEWGYFLEACRYYPSELKDPTKRHNYRMLERIRDADPRLHHADADYGDLNLVDIDVTPTPEGLTVNDAYDMVVFSTCLYQSYPEKQRKMFDNALKHVKFGGKIVVQDFCTIEEVNPAGHPIDRLRFIGPSSKPYTYTTFVYDTLRPEEGLQPFVYWNNGRCEKLRTTQMLRGVVE